MLFKSSGFFTGINNHFKVYLIRMFRLICEEVSSSTLRPGPDYKMDISDDPLGLLQTTICSSEEVFSIFISNPNKSENWLGRDAFKY